MATKPKYDKAAHAARLIKELAGLGIHVERGKPAGDRVAGAAAGRAWAAKHSKGPGVVPGVSGGHPLGKAQAGRANAPGVRSGGSIGPGAPVVNMPPRQGMSGPPVRQAPVRAPMVNSPAFRNGGNIGGFSQQPPPSAFGVPQSGPPGSIGRGYLPPEEEGRWNPLFGGLPEEGEEYQGGGWMPSLWSLMNRGR